jgi:hypothetical protein
MSQTEGRHRLADDTDRRCQDCGRIGQVGHDLTLELPRDVLEIRCRDTDGCADRSRFEREPTEPMEVTFVDRMSGLIR